MSIKNINNHVYKVSICGILSAVASLLMFFQIGIPFVPSYLKLDFSELPALLASFSVGPIAGVAVCAVKNIIHLTFTSTAGIGELSNFIIGTCLVFPAGLIYKLKKNRRSAFIGSTLGAIVMCIVSIFTNYFIVYPFYFTTLASEEVIVSMYSSILPLADTLIKGILIFNVPFTFIKGALNISATFVLYKKLSPLLKKTT